MTQIKLFRYSSLAVVTLLLINSNDTYQLPFEPEKIIRYNLHRALLSSQPSSNTTTAYVTSDSTPNPSNNPTTSQVMNYKTIYTTGSPKMISGSFSNESKFPVYEIGAKWKFQNFVDGFTGIGDGGWYTNGIFSEPGRLSELSRNIVKFVKSELQIPTDILVQDLIIKGQDPNIKQIDARENRFIAFHGWKDPPEVFCRSFEEWKTSPKSEEFEEKFELWTVVLNTKNQHRLYWPIAYALGDRTSWQGWIYVFEFQLNEQKDKNWISLADCNGKEYCSWDSAITIHGRPREGSDKIQARTGYHFPIVDLIYPNRNDFYNYPDAVVIPKNAMLQMKNGEIKAAFKVHWINQ